MSARSELACILDAQMQANLFPAAPFLWLWATN